MLPGSYAPRSAAGTVLHQVVGAHLERFLTETAAATDGAAGPLTRKGYLHALRMEQIASDDVEDPVPGSAPAA